MKKIMLMISAIMIAVTFNACGQEHHEHNDKKENAVDEKNKPHFLFCRYALGVLVRKH